MTLRRAFLLVCLPVVFLFTLSPIIIDDAFCAITTSVGEPFRGCLINGVKFPSNMHGYKLGDEDRSYTTPEVVGALLDAFERFGERYPDSCDLFLGHFSRKGGGRLGGHESHQNGRDVDIGLFAKNNLQLDGFVPMDSKILDVSKTWHMIQCLLETQSVQTIYLDKSIQSQLYKYALGEGADRDLLSRVFTNAGGRGETECIMQHEPGHRNHMHIRFVAPWSTLAAREKDPQTRMVIESAQLCYLPRRVDYYVRENDKDLSKLTKVFGVRYKDLRKWNSLFENQIPRPGERVVFYLFGTKPPVQLARSLKGVTETTPPLSPVRGGNTIALP